MKIVKPFRKPKEIKKVYYLNHWYSFKKNRKWLKFKPPFGSPMFTSEYKIEGKKCYVRFRQKRSLWNKFINIFKEES
jgi:hypothetical protein